MVDKLKIGVFGGTFNPIHNSHIYLAKEYARQLSLDRVIIVPSNLPPHKPAENLAGGEDRLSMCRLATKDIPHFRVIPFELEQGGKSYIYKTLRYLSREYPGSELYLLMGGDMFLTVQDWKRAPEIFKLATICAGQREKGEQTALDAHKQVLEAEGARCVIIGLEAIPLSSTQVRERIAAGERPKELVHPDVWDYIARHGLYRCPKEI